MKRHVRFVSLCVLLNMVGLPATAAPNGSFSGPVVTQWLDDGRHMVIVKPFVYTDSTGTEWPVPVGTIVDGASIPKVAWGAVGGPFEGKYRAASVVHDLYCDRRARPSKAVHRVFYDAMIASDVPESQARKLYGAVKLGGPKWDRQAVVNNTMPVIEALTESQADQLIKQRIANFSAEQIDLAELDDALLQFDANQLAGMQEAVNQDNPTLYQIDYASAKAVLAPTDGTPFDYKVFFEKQFVAANKAPDTPGPNQP